MTFLDLIPRSFLEEGPGEGFLIMENIFSHILCPVDFSEHSSMAVRYAEAFATGGKGKMVLFHTVPDLAQEISYIDGNYVQTVREGLMSTANDKLDAFGPSASDQVQIERRVGQGNPADAILQEAQGSAADLIVMGTHGWGGYERFLLGSVTNKVLHKSVVPVLVVCHPTHDFVRHHDHTVQIRRILCAMELEPSDNKVVSLAISLARNFGSEILFLHVARDADGQDWFEQEKVSLRKMKELVNSEKENGCPKEFIVEAGKPAERITYAVERYGIDLLVMGHHSPGSREEPVLGSVATRVVSNSACPVLVYRSHSHS